MPGPIRTERDAIRFMKSASFVLRYNPTPSLPLASMYAAAGDPRRAIELTNALLAKSEVVETNVIANRLVLVHRDAVPALYALRTRFRNRDLSLHAQRASRLIERNGTASAGVPERGIPYLSKEGFPYRVFATAHADLVRAASRTKADDAFRTIVEAAGTIPPKKLVAMFKLCLTPDERQRLLE
jgi:hypothetical protein